MKQLGRIVGMTESTISLYERGIHEPDMETMCKIADALNVSTDNLIGRESPDEKKEAAQEGGNVREAISRLYDEIGDLTDEEAEFVRASIAGIKAARKPV